MIKYNTYTTFFLQAYRNIYEVGLNFSEKNKANKGKF